MNSDFEESLRAFLKMVVREVVDELLQENIPNAFQYSSDVRPNHGEERLLLQAKEAAKRLSISTTYLRRLTRERQLPCVKVGRSVRYSIETLQLWIHKMESTSSRNATKENETARRSNDPIKSQPSSNLQIGNSSRRRVLPKTIGNTLEVAAKLPNKKRQIQKRPSDQTEERHNSPFDTLLKELGVDRASLPNLTNGELMRIADVDIPTLHGWIYLNRELPRPALNKLRQHFIRYREK